MLCHLQVFISKQAQRKRRKQHDCIAKACGGCKEITFKPVVCFTATLAGGSGDSSGCPEGAGPEMLRFENKSVFDVQQSYFFPCRHGCSSEFHVHFFFFFLFIPSRHKTTSGMRLEPVAPKDTFNMSSRQEFSSNRTRWYGSSWMRAGRVLTAGLNPRRVTRRRWEPPINAACTCSDQRKQVGVQREHANISQSWHRLEP